MSDREELRTTGDLLAIAAVLAKFGAAQRSLALALAMMLNESKQEAIEALSYALRDLSEAGESMDAFLERTRERIGDD